MSTTSITPNHKNAYVWLIIKGDRYLPGIIASVYSVLKTKPVADLVVMVTPDVSQSAIDTISKTAKVSVVDYIEFKGKFNHDDPLQKYSPWIESSYTKWQCLGLPYEKVLLLDSDLIVVNNIDELFAYSAPAGIFQQQKPLYKTVLSKYLDKRRNIPEKTMLLDSDIVKLLNTKDQLLATATAILLEPTKNVKHFIDSITQMKDCTYPNATGVDEQSIAYYMSVVLKKSWTVLSTKYNAVPWWKYNGIIGHVYGKVLHFMTKEKPWERDTSEFPELMMWSKVYFDAMNHVNKLILDDVNKLLIDPANKYILDRVNRPITGPKE